MVPDKHIMFWCRIAGAVLGSAIVLLVLVDPVAVAIVAGRSIALRMDLEHKWRMELEPMCRSNPMHCGRYADVYAFGAGNCRSVRCSPTYPNVGGYLYMCTTEQREHRHCRHP